MKEKTRDAVAEIIDASMGKCLDVLEALEGEKIHDAEFVAVAAVAVNLQKLARLTGVDVSHHIETVKAPT